jgi:hypothetical protein
MSYYDYRSFIRGKILGVCPDIKEHKDGFNRDNIDSITSDEGYHILPTSITSDFVSSQCDNYEDTLNVSLQLIFCGGRYVTDQMDKALAKAHCIRNELIKREQFPVDGTLTRLLVSDIALEPAVSNDNTVLVNMDLILILQYCTDSCA